jgi:hypothetical protein
MSAERLNGVEIEPIQWLDSNFFYQIPLGGKMEMNVFQIKLEHDPNLNPDFYVDAKWLTHKQIVELSMREDCGKCTEMFLEYLKWHRIGDVIGDHGSCKGWVRTATLQKP